jgi:ERCC4-type nuclease
MHPVDVDASLKSMVCLVDTREQDTPAFRERISHFDQWERHKLDAGDYSAKFLLPDSSWFFLPVAIERKYAIDELCMCYCQQRGRFEREFERALEAHSKLYLLVEGGNWENVYSGKYRSQMNPKSLVGSILAWLARYNCQLMFCKKETSGQLIKDILYREGKEALLKLDQ